MRRYIADIINWGIDHFWGWVVGILITAGILEIAKYPAINHYLEWVKASQQSIDMIGIYLDIQWWVMFVYSATAGLFKWLRNYNIYL